MANKDAFRLGVDLGGTKILGVLVQGEKVLAVEKCSTVAEEGYPAVLERITAIVRAVRKSAGVKRRQLERIGIGVPGPVSDNRLLQAPNLGWKGTDLAFDLANLTRIEHVHLANDVNCGALGEATLGAGMGRRSVFALFVGTGLGGGWVHRGHVHEGSYGFAGEVGHMRVPGQTALCGCGQLGCLETVASKRGLSRMLREAVDSGQPCAVENRDQPKSSAIELAYRSGCPSTVAAVNAVGAHLGWAITAIATVIDPNVFVLGGGIAERLGHELLPGIEAARTASPFISAHTDFDVQLGKLGGEAVALGAAQLGHD